MRNQPVLVDDTIDARTNPVQKPIGSTVRRGDLANTIPDRLKGTDPVITRPTSIIEVFHTQNWEIP